MSDQRTKQERSKAKDLRQSPAPDTPSTGKRRGKVDKPYKIFIKAKGGECGIMRQLWPNWTLFKRVKTQKIAEEWIDKDRSKGLGLEYKIELAD
ncbi:MAG TPA: hypothetical protein DCS09_02605 [Porphyromonadaceae bacterium]|nr:hypothetical protein [Porphyromonadaceae bacterium]